MSLWYLGQHFHIITNLRGPIIIDIPDLDKKFYVNFPWLLSILKSLMKFFKFQNSLHKSKAFQ